MEQVNRSFFVVSQGVRVELSIDREGFWKLQGDRAEAARPGDEVLRTQNDLQPIYESYGIYKPGLIDAVVAKIEPLIAPLFRGDRANRAAEAMTLAAKTPWERTGRIR